MVVFCISLVTNVTCAYFFPIPLFQWNVYSNFWTFLIRFIHFLIIKLWQIFIYSGYIFCQIGVCKYFLPNYLSLNSCREFCYFFYFLYNRSLLKSKAEICLLCFHIEPSYFDGLHLGLWSISSFFFFIMYEKMTEVSLFLTFKNFLIEG